MPDGFSVGGPQFGLRDTKIGTWDGDGTYSNVADVFSVQVLGMRIESESTDLEGDDGVTATAVRAKKGTVTLRMGGIDLFTIGLFAPGVYSTGYTTPNIYKRHKVSNKKAPYVGICGQAMAEEGEGDTHLFAPKMKLAQPFELRFEGNNFAIPEVTFTAVYDNNFNDGEGNSLLFDFIEHETAIDVSLPPAY